MSEKENIGIIAGEGALPSFVSLEAISQGYNTYAIAHNKQSQRDINGHYTDILVTPITQLQRIVNYLKDNNIKRIIAIGKFKKLELLKQLTQVDKLALNYTKKLINLEDNTFHQIVEEGMQELGFEFIPQSYFLQKYFAQAQIYTRQPTEQEQLDIDYGISMANKSSELEVSQTVVIKNQSVMAFEAVEGTDETIIRGCKYAGSDAVIVKVPWKTQSPYFDLPTIGPRTLNNIAKNKGSVLAVKADKTFIVEKEECIKIANKHNICFLSF